MHNPFADPQAMITRHNARFTVLTPQLIRMEWSANRQFVDDASLVFINRRMPVPQFEARTAGKWLHLQTEKLLLRYKASRDRFTKENLEISFELNGKCVAWQPGKRDHSNLRGTTRTLDAVSGATQLEPGLLSRKGWALVNDSKRPQLDDSAWPWVKSRPNSEQQDWYFFGYGHDYKQALYDFTRVAGKIPMPPRFAFGTWWSRYWAYTDQELKQLVEEFEHHNVPLDVLVIDMDWHLTFNLRWWNKRVDQAGQRMGWTGYTWDKNLFPDPTAFLGWLARKGLKKTLNLHPASGVLPHEERYAEMARAMGLDPATKRHVPFDIANKTFAENYLNILHHPLEEQGVDFWWLDWQQGDKTQVAGLNPTWWLNYVHFTDMERRKKARPLIFHRWGGLGNHRYQIGFSGDTYSNWESLAFQPYFTSTAANVGYGYWSHDIGGHMPGEVTPELYTRWLQFGVFSPILRTHTTRNAKADRRIWNYPNADYNNMRAAYLLRYALLPYIYNAARQTYDTGVSMCRPMYYDWPECEEAYTARDQYFFGNDLLVAPITAPISPKNSLAQKQIWLPQGQWFEWFTGTMLTGATFIERSFALEEIPVYVKAGTIIPMQPEMMHTRAKPIDPLILMIFPGEQGETCVYEDEGDSLGYQTGECAWTRARHEQIDPTTKRVTILPVEGKFPGMLASRSYELRLPCAWPPEEVFSNGAALRFSREGQTPSWRYEGEQVMLLISLPNFACAEKVEVLIKTAAALVEHNHLLNGVRGKLARLQRVMPWLNGLWPQEWSPEALIVAAQTGNRISLSPANALQEMQTLAQKYSEAVASIAGIHANQRIVARALRHLRAE